MKLSFETDFVKISDFALDSNNGHYHYVSSKLILNNINEN